jgi:hypothetical protein
METKQFSSRVCSSGGEDENVTAALFILERNPPSVSLQVVNVEDEGDPLVWFAKY